MRVFVGGTYKDIHGFRQVAYDVLRKHAPVETMEDFPTSEMPVRDLCLDRVKKCTHYLLIIGRRYGWIPEGETKSITELEYECAVQLGLPRKIYIYEPYGSNASVLALDDQAKLDTFKERVRMETPRSFEDEGGLPWLLEVTMRDWFGGDTAATPQQSPVMHTEQLVVNAQSVQVTASAIMVSDLIQGVEQAKGTVTRLIEYFPVDAQPKLMKAMDEVSKELLRENPDVLKSYLHHYRFPFTFDNLEVDGVEQLIELLTVLKSEFENINLVHQDTSANLCLDEQQGKWALLVHAVQRHTAMPEVVLELVRRMLKTSQGQRALRRGEPLLPNSLILDNFSRHKKVNLCGNCQNQFTFKDILKDYTRGEEISYFLGVENNDFETLDETKVFCGNCLRDLHNEVSTYEELRQQVRRIAT